MLKSFESDIDVIENISPFVLPSFKVDELVRAVQRYPSLDEAKKDFRKRKIVLPPETGIVVIYNNKVIDYIDIPGNYYWLGTETNLKSCKYAKFLDWDVKQFEQEIQNVLNQDDFYIYALNIHDLHSFPLFVENPLPFKDTRYGDLLVRFYCSIDARVTNPFAALARLIIRKKDVLMGTDLFVGKEDLIRQNFYESLNEATADKVYSFESPEGLEFSLSPILLPKLFKILYKEFGIHGNKININSILPDAISKDIIEEIDTKQVYKT